MRRLIIASLLSLAPAAAFADCSLVYRGDVCNCQARALFDDGRIIALVLRSAC